MFHVMDLCVSWCVAAMGLLTYVSICCTLPDAKRTADTAPIEIMRSVVQYAVGQRLMLLCIAEKQSRRHLCTCM